MTGNIAHHSAKGLMFALPVAASQPKRLPIPWDASAPYKGLGYREIEAGGHAGEVRDHRIAGGLGDAAMRLHRRLLLRAGAAIGLLAVGRPDRGAGTAEAPGHPDRRAKVHLRAGRNSR